MEQWSILSNMINYIQYDKHPKNFHSFSISMVNKEKGREKSNIKGEEKPRLELDFEDTPDKLKEEYLDVYDGIVIYRGWLFFFASWCYAITHALCIYTICMCTWWWSHHMTSSGKHYKRGFQLLVYHRECWLWIEYICYSVCLR